MESLSTMKRDTMICLRGIELDSKHGHNEEVEGLAAGIMNSADCETRSQCLSEMITWIGNYKMPEEFQYMNVFGDVLVNLVACRVPVIAAKAALLVANCFSMNGSKKLARCLLNYGVVKALNEALSAQNDMVIIPVLRALTRIGTCSDAGRLSLMRDVSLETLGMILSSTYAIETCTADCKSLLNAFIVDEMMPNDAKLFCIFLWQMADVIKGRAIVCISRIARWVPDFQFLPFIQEIVDMCVILLQSDDVGEVQAALVTLSYSGAPVNDNIRSMVFSSNSQISITALWWLGKYVKEHPEALTQIADSNTLSYAMTLLLGEHSFYATVEAAYFFCRLITSASHTFIQSILPAVKGIGSLVGCECDWRVTTKILRTLFSLAKSLPPSERDELFDEELLSNLETLSAENTGAAGILASEILDTLCC